MRYKEVLQRVKGDGNILQTIKPKKPTWIGYILHRDCHLRQCFSTSVRPRPGKFFFYKTRMTRKYLSIFLSSYIKVT